MTQNIPAVVNRRLTNLAIVLARTPAADRFVPGVTGKTARLDLSHVYRAANTQLGAPLSGGYGIVTTWAPWAGSVDAPTHTEAVVCVQDANRNALVWRWVLPVNADWDAATIVSLLDPRCAVIYEDDIFDEREELYNRGLAILKEHYKAEMRNFLLNTARLYPAEDIPPQRNNRCILLDTR